MLLKLFTVTTPPETVALVGMGTPRNGSFAGADGFPVLWTKIPFPAPDVLIVIVPPADPLLMVTLPALPLLTLMPLVPAPGAMAWLSEFTLIVKMGGEETVTPLD